MFGAMCVAFAVVALSIVAHFVRLVNDERKEEKRRRKRNVEPQKKINEPETTTAIWRGLVLHNKDIFAAHVLPKMSETDRFFFALADDAGEKMLRYAGVSVPRFQFSSCSSISTLEFAWGNFPWGMVDYNTGKLANTADFCIHAATANKIELLKWAIEKKKCKWHPAVIIVAAREGNIEMLKYCFDHNCPVNEDYKETACREAVAGGHLDCVKFLVDEKKCEYGENRMMSEAARFNHVGIIKYIIEEKNCDDSTLLESFYLSVRKGHLECVKYFVECMQMPKYPDYICLAKYSEHFEVLDYLREKEFPEPSEREYESFCEPRRAIHQAISDLSQIERYSKSVAFGCRSQLEQVLEQL